MRIAGSTGLERAQLRAEVAFGTVDFETGDREILRDLYSEKAEDYWIEYEIGQGLRAVSGAFAVNQPRLSVGPFPRSFWDDLATHNPYRIRILAPDRRLKSPWVIFEIEATTARP